MAWFVYNGGMATERATRVKEIEPGVWEYTDRSVRYYNHPNHRSGAMVRKAGVMDHPSITPATARALVLRKHELWQQAAIDGMIAGTGKRTAPAAWAAIAEARSKVAVSDAGTPGNQAAEFVGRAAGAYGQQAEQQQQPALELRLSGAAVEQLAQLLQQRQAAAGQQRQDGADNSNYRNHDDGAAAVVDAEATELT